MGGQTTKPVIVSSKKLFVIIVGKGGILRGGASNHKEDTKEEMGGGKREPSGGTEQGPEEDPDEKLGVYMIGKSSNHPIQVELQLDGKAVTMEVDTGVAVSLISEQRLKQVLPKAAIHNTAVVLQNYTSERIPVRGELQVMVHYGDQKKQLALYVTKGDGPCLMGREGLESIRLDWRTIGLATMDATETKLHTLLET